MVNGNQLKICLCDYVNDMHTLYLGSNGEERDRFEDSWLFGQVQQT